MCHATLAARFAVAALFVAAATLAATANVPLTATLQAQTEKVHKPGVDGVTLPIVVTEVKPEYTPAAMQERIQGALWLTVVVLASGDVGDVTITKSLDAEYGLDQQAIDAARQWKFKPATRRGQPVPVEITVEMRFTLK